MSADNGIYIAEFPEGFRVAYAFAIDNIDYYPEGSKERKDVLREYFGKSEVYDNEDEARQRAWDIQDEYDWTEYGIQVLGKYESFDEAKP